ncbi:MAG: glycoside hydrolase domain-containing protein, partial [Promethearchaeota archaeon]
PEGYNSSKIWQSFKDNPILVLKEQLGILFIALFSGVRVLTPFVILSSLWYGFPTVFYLPDFLFNVTLWGLLGVFLYKIGSKNKKMLNSIYFLCLIFLTLLIFMINTDIVVNAYSYYDVLFDRIFPFQVLLSTAHAAIVGISSGFILSYELRRLTFDFVDKSNGPIRSLLVSSFPIVLGLFIPVLSIRGVPGGEIGGNSYLSWNSKFVPKLFLEDNLLVPFILIAVLFALILLFDIIIPLLNKKMQKKGKFKLTINSRKTIRSESRSLHLSKNQIYGLLLGLMVALPVGLTVTIPKIVSGLSMPMLGSNGAVDIYGAPSNIRIGNQQPLIPENNIKMSQYNISLARNEYESMQLVFKPKNQRSLNGLRYSFTDFVNGNDSISKQSITIRYVENVYEEMPERLVDFSYIHLIEQRNHIFWITAYAPYNANPGSYIGNITFTHGNDETVTIKLSLDVWNFTLPNQRHIRSNFGPQTDDKAHIQTYLSHNINSYGIPVRNSSSINQLQTNEIYTAFVNSTTNEWTFNWTWWDEQTQYLLDNGQNGFFITCPLGMPREPWWLENDDLTNLSQWGIQNKNFYAGGQSHFDDLKLNQSKNWFNYAYVYFIDEFQMFVPEGYTRSEYWDALEVFLDLIKTSAPDLKIMTTTPPSYELAQLNPYIDIYCPVSYDYNETEWNNVLEQGKELWMYACAGPRAPYPNSHGYNKLYEIRVLYWQVWRYNLHGFLYWRTTPYYHGQYGYGYNSWGDAWYLYKNNDGSMDDTIRWENFRDATDDYEYIWLMNKTIDLQGNNEADKNYLTSLIDSVSGDTYNYANSGKEVNLARSKIGNWISHIMSSNKIDLQSISEQEWTPP